MSLWFRPEVEKVLRWQESRVSDETIQRYKRELERSGVDPKDMAAEILGTERGRYFGITSLPVNDTSYKVEIGALTAPRYPRHARQKMWATPLDKIETVIEILRIGTQGANEGVPSLECVCTIYDDKNKLVVGDLNVGWPLGHGFARRGRVSWRAVMDRSPVAPTVDQDENLECSVCYRPRSIGCEDPARCDRIAVDRSARR